MITKTWLSQGDAVPLNEATPPGFAYFNISRPSGRVGGLVVFYKSVLNATHMLLLILIPLKF